jgi:hypothetical protein
MKRFFEECHSKLKLGIRVEVSTSNYSAEPVKDTRSSGAPKSSTPSWNVITDPKAAPYAGAIPEIYLLKW